MRCELCILLREMERASSFLLPYLRVKGIHVYIRRFDNRNSLGSNNWTIKCIWIICLYICGFPQAWKVSSLSCKQPWPSQEDSACFCLPHPPNPPRHDDRACFSHIVEYFYSTSSYAKKVCNQMSWGLFLFFSLLLRSCCWLLDAACDVNDGM